LDTWQGPACLPACLPAYTQYLNQHPLRLAPLQDGKFALGKLRGGKMDDITVLVAYVTEEQAVAA
jgi:hypothetical protein